MSYKVILKAKHRIDLNVGKDRHYPFWEGDVKEVEFDSKKEFEAIFKFDHFVLANREELDRQQIPVIPSNVNEIYTNDSYSDSNVVENVSTKTSNPIGDSNNDNGKNIKVSDIVSNLALDAASLCPADIIGSASVESDQQIVAGNNICGECGLKFNSPKGLRLHMTMKHKRKR